MAAIPFAVHAGFLVQKVGWANGTTVGNGTVEVGVYTEDGGTLLGSASATTAGPSALQAVAVGSPFHIEPGRYYLACLAGSATDTFHGLSTSVGPMEAIGVRNAANNTGSLRASETWAIPSVTKVPTLFLAGHTVY